MQSETIQFKSLTSVDVFQLWMYSNTGKMS